MYVCMYARQYACIYVCVPVCMIVCVCVCKTLASVSEPHQMLKAIQHFGRHCSCHLQGEYVSDGCSFGGIIRAGNYRVDTTI
jgi:hypothetical protein